MQLALLAFRIPFSTYKGTELGQKEQSFAVGKPS